MVGTSLSNNEHEDTMTSMTPAIRQKYDVNVEGTIYGWSEPTITAAQIRMLAGFDDAQPMIEVDLKDNTERTLVEGVPVHLRPGLGFAKKVRFQRG
jgi:hypothetical protein